MPQTVQAVRANPSQWPHLGFLDTKDASAANTAKRALLNGLLREMQVDYERSSSGTLSPDQARYYTEMSALLYQRGGYSNWHLAQVLDFRVAYSIAKQAYTSGAVGSQDQALVKGLASRVWTADSIVTLVREELDPKLADPLIRLTPEVAMNEGFDLLAKTGQDWPPLLTGEVLKRKALSELTWRSWLHAMFVQLSVPALVDAMPKIDNWGRLKEDQKAAAILANVVPSNYRCLGFDRLEDRNVTTLLTLVTDTSSPFNDLRKE